MICNSATLREKDVVNVCDGRRLGYICDYVIDTECGKICAIYVSDHLFSFSGQKNTIKIGWECISCIGDDTVLVRVSDYSVCREGKCDGDSEKKKKSGWFL